MKTSEIYERLFEDKTMSIGQSILELYKTSIEMGEAELRVNNHRSVNDTIAIENYIQLLKTQFEHLRDNLKISGKTNTQNH